MSTAFMLAHPYGLVRVMSSYYWPRTMINGTDVNSWMGPPASNNMSTLEVFDENSLDCKNGWASRYSNTLTFEDLNLYIQ